MLTPREERVYNLLIERAKQGKVVWYSEVADLIGLNLSNENERWNILPEILDNINIHEIEQGRRMLLTSIVVYKRDKIPGGGYFTLAKREKLQKAGEDDLIFLGRQMNEVWAYWKTLQKIKK